jgi:membrane-anchored mycosin MYCP
VTRGTHIITGARPAVLAAGAAAGIAAAALISLHSPSLHSPSLPPHTVAPIRASLLTSQCRGYSAAVHHGVPWAQSQLRPAAVWGLTTGAGQTVAVLDDGVSAQAPALAGAVLPGLVIGSKHPADTDCTGHGTFVAGLIAARPSGTGFTGLAPGATILPVNVVSSNGLVTSAAAAAGIRYAVASGATIIDYAAPSAPRPSAALRAAVEQALDSDVVVIAWVGSSASGETNRATFPADYPGVIAVSAVDSAGTPLAAGSPDVPVDLAAPGYEITSIGPIGPGELSGGGPAIATAFVTGTAALVRSYYPGLSAAQVVSRMEATASAPGIQIPDAAVGYGTIDPYTAVTEMLGTAAASPVAPVPEPHLPPRTRADTWPLTATALIGLLVMIGLIGAAAGRHIRRSARQLRHGAAN